MYYINMKQQLFSGVNWNKVEWVQMWLVMTLTLILTLPLTKGNVKVFFVFMKLLFSWDLAIKEQKKRV